MTIKVGLLLPKSAIYPSIAFDIVGGLRSGMEHFGANLAEIKTESIGVAGSDKFTYAACEKLLLEGVNVIAAYVNPTTAETLDPLFASANAILIALDSGYHFPTSLKKLSRVFYISLQGALCCSVTTKVALADGVKKAAFTESFYDAGFRSAYCFHHVLNDGGGEITYNHITALKRADFTLGPLAGHLKGKHADALFASFCGDMFQDFCNAAAAEKIFDHFPVYGSSFMGEEQWLLQCPYPGTDIKTCVPWASTLVNDANMHFIGMPGNKKQKVNVFSLLGWEAGQVITKISSADDIDAAIAGLEDFNYTSPRGEVLLDGSTHQSHAPVYEAIVVKNEETGNCLLVPEKESAYTEEQRQQLANYINSNTETMSSWFNAYPCLDS